MMECGIVVAMTRDHVIGNNGHLPWHISSDLKRFKEITTGNGVGKHAVIMGRRTWDSLPKSVQPLPHRFNIVVTSQHYANLDGVVFVKSVEEGMISAELNDVEYLWFIGGSQLYEAAIPLCSYLHVTWVEAKISGDVYFPCFSEKDWLRVYTKSFSLKNDEHATTYVRYERILPSIRT